MFTSVVLLGLVSSGQKKYLDKRFTCRDAVPFKFWSNRIVVGFLVGALCPQVVLEIIRFVFRE